MQQLNLELEFHRTLSYACVYWKVIVKCRDTDKRPYHCMTYYTNYRSVRWHYTTWLPFHTTIPTKVAVKLVPLFMWNVAMLCNGTKYWQSWITGLDWWTGLWFSNLLRHYHTHMSIIKGQPTVTLSQWHWQLCSQYLLGLVTIYADSHTQQCHELAALLIGILFPSVSLKFCSVHAV